MPTAITALVILVLIMILFITEAIPLPVTAVLGAVSMAVFGVIGFSDAFAGFASDTTMMVIGMLIVAQGVYECGILDRIRHVLERMVSIGERSSIALFSTVTAAISGFFSDTATTAVMLSSVKSMAASTKRKTLPRTLFMPIAIAAVLGGNLTLVGSVPQLIAQGVLQEQGLETMGFFTLAKGALPLLVIGVLYCATIGRRLTKSSNFAEAGEDGDASPIPETDVRQTEPSKLNMIVTVSVFIFVIAGFVSGIWTMGTVAITGALVLLVTRSITLRSVVVNVDWGSIVILGGCLGFCAGIDVSGAGALIANAIIDLCGGVTTSPIVIFAVMIVVTSILTNFMQNTACTAMIVPIGLLMATTMGFNPLTMAVGLVYAANISFCTPIATVPMTLTLSAGFRFIDYIKINLPLTILLVAATIVLTPLLYGF